MALLIDTIEKVRERLNPGWSIDGILATMYDSRTVHGREVFARVVEAFGDNVFHTVISRTVRFPETTVAGRADHHLGAELVGRPAVSRTWPRRCSPDEPASELPGAAELFRPRAARRPGSGDPQLPLRAAEPRRRPERAAERPARLGAPREEELAVPRRTRSTAALRCGRGRAEPAGYGGGTTGRSRCAAADRPRGRLRRRPRCRVARRRIRQTRRQPLRGAAGPPAERPGEARREDHRLLLGRGAVELERARLALRGDHGLVVDRGRIVREAVAVVLADLEAKGESSILVRRLRES